MSMTVEMILRLIDQASTPLRGVSSELGKLKGESDKLNAAQGRGVAGALAQQKAWADAAKEHAAFNDRLVGPSHWIGGAAAAGAAALTTMAVSGVKHAITYEKAMADFKKAYDLQPGQNWDQIGRMLDGISLKTGVAREEIVGLAASGMRSGILFEDIERFTLLTAQAASAWDMNEKQASKYLSQLKSQLRMTLPELGALASQINEAADTSNAAESDIIKALSTSADAARAANVPLQTTAASLTAMIDAGMNPDVASRFFNAFSSGLATAGEGGKGAKKMAEGLRELGMSIEQVQQGMRDNPTKTILDLLGQLDKSPNKAAIGVKLFGKEWWDEAARFSAVIGKIISQLEMLNSGKWKGSLEKNFEKDLETTENHFKRFQNMMSMVLDRNARWILPPINSAIEQSLKFNDWLEAGIGSRETPESKAAYERTHEIAEEWRRDNRRRLWRRSEAPVMDWHAHQEAPAAIPAGRSLPAFASFEGMPGAAKPSVDTSEMKAAAETARQTGQEIDQALSVTVTPRVDVGQIASALGLARELANVLAGIPGAVSRAGGAVRGVAAGSHALHDGPEAR